MEIQLPQKDNRLRGQLMLYALLWLVVMAIYWPARQAGFVADTTGWLESLQQDSFSDYLLRSRFEVKSLYLFTQLSTWFWYKIFGVSPLAWHILQCSFHALNAFLVFLLSRDLLAAGGLRKPATFAGLAAFLFAVHPYCSEVVVWESAYHYLQGLCLQLLVLRTAQRYFSNGKRRFLLISGVLFLLSIFTHELFYTTPVLLVLLAFYYRNFSENNLRNLISRIRSLFSVVVIGVVVYAMMYLSIYGLRIAHAADGSLQTSWKFYAIKWPYYAFHLFFLGRLWPPQVRTAVYAALRSVPGMIASYGLLLALLGVPCIYFKRMQLHLRLVWFSFLAMLAAGSVFVAVWFPETGLVYADRYCYTMLPWLCLLFSLLLLHIGHRPLRLLSVIVVGLVLVLFSTSLASVWQQSQKLIIRVGESVAIRGSKPRYFLNVPVFLNGIPLFYVSGNEGISTHFQVVNRDDTALLVESVMGMYLERENARIRIAVTSQNSLIVTLADGSKSWNFGKELPTGWETDDYNISLLPGNESFLFSLKKPLRSATILYFSNGKVQTLDLPPTAP